MGLSLVALHNRLDVLQKPFKPIAPHILVSLTIEVLGRPPYDLGCQTGLCGRLEQRQLIELVIFIVNDDKAGNSGVLFEPRQDFVTARALGHVRRYVDERNAPVLGAKEPSRVVSPGGGQDDLRAGLFKQALKAHKQTLIDHVWEFAWVGRLLAVQNAVNIQENDLHLFYDFPQISQPGGITTTRNPGRRGAHVRITELAQRVTINHSDGRFLTPPSAVLTVRGNEAPSGPAGLFLLTASASRR
jgi:hypothetical protein